MNVDIETMLLAPLRDIANMGPQAEPDENDSTYGLWEASEIARGALDAAQEELVTEYLRGWRDAAQHIEQGKREGYGAAGRHWVRAARKLDHVSDWTRGWQDAMLAAVGAA